MSLTLVIHEILSKLLHVASESAELHKLMEIKERDQSVFWISRNINDLFNNRELDGV